MNPPAEFPLIAPPVPAPYLGDVDQLPDDLLRAMDARRRMTRQQRSQADRLLALLKAKIRQARRELEDRLNVEIVSELPYGLARW